MILGQGVASEPDTAIESANSTEQDNENKQKNFVYSWAVKTLQNLGIDSGSLTDEETESLRQVVSQTIAAYRPEWEAEESLSQDEQDSLSKYERLCWSDEVDQAVNGWLVKCYGLTIDELAAIQGFRLAGENGVESVIDQIINNRRQSRNVPLPILLDTQERRAQITNHPLLLEFRQNQQVKRAQILKSKGIVAEDDKKEEKDKYQRIKEIRESMRGSGKSEQEIKQEIDKKLERTGD